MSNAYENLKAAYERHVARFTVMSSGNFRAEIVAMWRQAGEPDCEQIADALVGIASEGSIAAAAALHVLADDDESLREKSIAAFLALADRSPDVREGAANAGLEELIIEYCEEQCALGVMSKSFEDGETFYSGWSRYHSGVFASQLSERIRKATEKAMRK